MDMINRGKFRMPVGRLFSLVLAGLFLVGCGAPARVAPSITANVLLTTTQCDGVFESQVRVTQQGHGFRQRTNVVLAAAAGGGNVNAGFTVAPASFFLGDGGQKQVTVRGKLTNSCNRGNLILTATGANSGITSGPTPIVIKPVPIKGTAPGGVTPNAQGKFNYDVILTCCPVAAGAVVTYRIDLQGIVNVTNLVANPTTVNCPSAGNQTVTVSGKLIRLEGAGKVGVLATGPASSTCNLITEVEPAR